MLSSSCDARVDVVWFFFPWVHEIGDIAAASGDDLDGVTAALVVVVDRHDLDVVVVVVVNDQASTTTPIATEGALLLVGAHRVFFSTRGGQHRNSTLNNSIHRTTEQTELRVSSALRRLIIFIIIRVVSCLLIQVRFAVPSSILWQSATTT